MSLVGEKERKLLKEIVKLAKTPVKSRIVPPGERNSFLYSVAHIVSSEDKFNVHTEIYSCIVLVSRGDRQVQN